MTGGKPIRIVHYQQQLRGHESGTSNAARGWCEALTRQGVDVVGLFDSADVGRPGPVGTETVALEHSLRGPLRTPRGVAEHILQADAVVIHGGWLLGNNVVGRACVRARVPFVITTHGVYMSEVLERRTLRKRVWRAAFERRYMSRASAVHVFFPEEYADLEREMKTKAPSIVAPNGIDYPDEMSWNGNEGYLLWLGRFDIVTKGLDLLVRAVERMPVQHRPQVRLHGPDWRNQKSQLQRLVGQLRVGPWVRIGDPVYGDEKWRLISNARACVYPSRWDACPVAVSEAAAMGVPTLVTRYPLGTFLATRGAAIQVDPDPSSIAEGIPRLMSPDSEGMGRNAAAVARRHLSWDAVATSWLNQFRGLIGE